MRVLAHRGASGTAFENSLAAFREARRLGADGVELDIHATVDGQFLVHHDPNVHGLGPIRDLVLSEARGHRLPNGEGIPTLAEAFAELEGLEVWVEVKALPSRFDAALLGILAGRDAALTGVHSFDHRIIARLGSARPELRRGILSVAYPVDPIAPLTAAGATALWQEWHLIDPELVKAVRRMGGEVIAWTVPDHVTAHQLAEFGVAAVCGNYPDRLRVR
jgi:glycerophosphoryl diester phosphodiesterase